MMNVSSRSGFKVENPLWLMLASFICYTGMYAVRKSFLAGQYLELSLWSMDFKTVLVISQVLGYMLSKFIGIKLVSEMKGTRRSLALLSFVSVALLMLALFPILPMALKPIALFFNGLPLGMVFGLVLSYLEGRRKTELLAAALSATFIFSTGFVKSSGIWLMQIFQVEEQWMPFYTGLLFFPAFVIAVWMLSVSQPPSKEDFEARTERAPMLRADRLAFMRQYGFSFSLLVLIYVLLTVVRDIRDNFIVDFWAGLGRADEAALVTLTELPIAVLILILAAFGVMIKDNLKAFRTGLWISLLCAAMLSFSSFFYQGGYLSALVWVVLTGFSLYLPYILFHTMVFERFIAALRFKGNVGFLFYASDALGYLASVLVMLYKEFGYSQLDWGSYMIWLNILAGLLLLMVSILALRRTRTVV